MRQNESPLRPLLLLGLLVILVIFGAVSACGAGVLTLQKKADMAATAAAMIPTDTPVRPPTPSLPPPTPTPLPADFTPPPTLPPMATPVVVATQPDTEPISQQPTATPEATRVRPTNTPVPKPTKVASWDQIMASPDFGAQAFLWWRPEIADRDLTLMQKAGFTWVKQWFAWKDIEGAARGQYDWTHTDRVVKQVSEKGLKLLVRVDREPKWAGPPPANADAFAEFLFAMATRYQGRIQAYQVWNEPNLAREWGNHRPNPEEYAILLRKAYRAIKRADPNAIVVSAGMAPTGTDNEIAMPDTAYYERLYQAMGGSSDGYFDMLGVHGAGYAAPPELDPAKADADKPKYGGERFFAFRHVEDIRDIMVRNGEKHKRMVILEFGWTTDPRPDSPYYWHGAGAGLDERLKGEYLVRAYRWAKEHWRPWIGLMSLVYMPDVDWTPNDEQYWWAIIEPSRIDELKLRPAFVMLCDYFYQERSLGRCPYLPK
ncbi:MAG TPA: hypothetical protein EYP04_09010 [Anaerolineae bacterium]|nr:hypothetical protein [Anaerolineae bacterium]HIQ05417.1 hypothetical protein [Anaerolineae bacterium]